MDSSETPVSLPPINPLREVTDPLNEIFATGGVTGALAASVDWSKTPLGPPATWPGALRTTLGILFASRHPMFLWWGPELIQFYNDAYLPSFANGKHPAAMGQQGEACWPEIWPIIYPQIQDVMERGKASWNENQLVPIYRNGRLEDVYWTYGYSPVRDEQGSIRGTLVVCTETTREVISRKEIERAHAEAQAARARLASLFQNAPAFVCALRGPEHVFELINAPLQRLIGNDRLLLGRPLAVAIPEIVPQGFGAILDRVFQTGEMTSGRETLVQLDRHGNGVLENAYVDWVFQPRFTSEGVVEGVDAFGFDVTDQAHARQRVEGLMEELKVAAQRKDEFLAALAHELRNPMAAIRISLEMVERSNGDKEKRNRHLAVAERQMRNLVRLVDDLLDVSRMSRGTVELRTAPIDFGAVVTNAVAATRPAFEAHQQKLEVTVPSHPVSVDGDETRLEQVVTNLLTNASKYSALGGDVSVHLTPEERPGVSLAVLRVRDSGRGIPPDMVGKVFDMFVQVDQTLDRSLGGLGLGLTLVKHFVQLHGGTVEAHSEGLGRGAEFVVRIPLMQAAASTPAHASSSESSDAGMDKSKQVLLVEDSEDVRETLRDFLVEVGHRVEVAVNGDEALQKLQRECPDIAFIDVGLPGIDGYEVARRIREVLGLKNLLLVAVTGYGDSQAKERAKTAGFDVHLTKPVDIAELLALLGRA